MAETAHFKPLSVAIGPAGSPAQQTKNTKRGGTERSPKKRGVGLAHALDMILTIFYMWGGPLDEFVKFEFRVGRSPNFGATGGQKSPFSYSAHIAYRIQQLVATAQAVISRLKIYLFTTAYSYTTWP